MANGKNNILVYRDWMHSFEKLTDDEAGQLIKHFFRYVNDLNPEPPNRIIEICFEPIKQTLKRDLKKWEAELVFKSKAGLASAEKRKQNQQVLTGVESVEQTPTHSTDRDSVSVNGSDTVNDKKIDRVAANAAALAERKKVFHAELKPFSKTYGGQYPPEMLTSFYNYWTELNPSGTKMRFQLEKTWETKKRLVTWANREKLNSNKNGTEKLGTSAARVEALKNWGVAQLIRPNDSAANGEGWTQVEQLAQP